MLWLMCLVLTYLSHMYFGQMSQEQIMWWWRSSGLSVFIVWRLTLVFYTLSVGNISRQLQTTSPLVSHPPRHVMWFHAFWEYKNTRMSFAQTTACHTYGRSCCERFVLRISLLLFFPYIIFINFVIQSAGYRPSQTNIILLAKTKEWREKKSIRKGHKKNWHLNQLYCLQIIHPGFVCKEHKWIRRNHLFDMRLKKKHNLEFMCCFIFLAFGRLTL